MSENAEPVAPSPLAPAILAADVALGLALALALRAGLPEPLADALTVESALGLAAAWAAVVMLVAMPVAARAVGEPRVPRGASDPERVPTEASDRPPAAHEPPPPPFGRAFPDALPVALAVAAVPLPLLAAVGVLTGSGAAAAAPLLGGLALVATLGALAVAAVRSTARAWPVPFALAAVVFFTAGPLAVLLAAHQDLRPSPDPLTASGASPLHALYSAAVAMAEPRLGESSEGLPDAPAPAGLAARIVRVEGPPGGLFRPGRPVLLGLDVEGAGLPDGAAVCVRTPLAELGTRIASDGARRRTVITPAVLDPAGLASASAVLRAAAGARLDMAWPEPLPSVTAVPGGVLAIGHVGGPDARRLAARVGPPGVPVRDAALELAAFGHAPHLLAETYDVVVVGALGEAGVDLDALADALVRVAAAGALVLVADDGVGAALARAEPTAGAEGGGGLRSAPEVGRIGAGGASRIGAASAEAAHDLVGARVAARRADDALRVGLSEEVTAALAVARTPPALARRVGIAATLAQSALLFALLLLRRRGGGRSDRRRTALLGAAVALAACVPVALAAPPTRTMATVATIMRGVEGSPIARRDEAVALGTFARGPGTAEVALVGPAPWPAGRRRFVPEPAEVDVLPRSVGAAGGAEVAFVVRPAWPGALVRAAPARIGRIALVEQGGAPAIENGTEHALADAIVIDAAGVRRLGEIAPGARAPLPPTAVSPAVFRAGLTGEQRLRHALIAPWLETADLARERVLVGWSRSEDPVAAGATLVGERPLALVVTLR